MELPVQNGNYDQIFRQVTLALPKGCKATLQSHTILILFITEIHQDLPAWYQHRQIPIWLKFHPTTALSIP